MQAGFNNNKQRGEFYPERKICIHKELIWSLVSTLILKFNPRFA